MEPFRLEESYCRHAARLTMCTGLQNPHARNGVAAVAADRPVRPALPKQGSSTTRRIGSCTVDSCVVPPGVLPRAARTGEPAVQRQTTTQLFKFQQIYRSG